MAVAVVDAPVASLTTAETVTEAISVHERPLRLTSRLAADRHKRQSRAGRGDKRQCRARGTGGVNRQGARRSSRSSGGIDRCRRGNGIDRCKGNNRRIAAGRPGAIGNCPSNRNRSHIHSRSHMHEPVKAPLQVRRRLT